MERSMICDEITYERTMTGSYMKVMSPEKGTDSCHEEKVLEHCCLQGLLDMQICLLDGRKQIWFAISGKQSLDTFCSIHKIGIDMVEQIIIAICRQIETLDNYLMDPDCLCLQQEMIYLTASDKEILFALVPQRRKPIRQQFRELMEYLLTRIDHGDGEAVKAAYRLYEKTLEEDYSIRELREAVIREHQKDDAKPLEKETAELPVPVPGAEVKQRTLQENLAIWDTVSLKGTQQGEKKKKGNKETLLGRFLKFLDHLIGEGEDDFVFEPEEEQEKTIRSAVYPTICLTDGNGISRGILLYEGSEALRDISLKTLCPQENSEVIIGKAEDCGMPIQKETISLYHARITRKGEAYELEDLNSTNGTFLNGEAIPYHEKRILHTGDMIRFADQRFRYI